MGNFKSLDEIQREKIEEEHRKFKEKLITDASDVIKGVGDNLTKDNEVKEEKRSFWNKLSRFLLVVLFLLVGTNLLLINIWVLRWVLTSLFG